MRVSDFNEVVKTQVNTCLDMLLRKADEYATEDRLHNFKVAAKVQDCTDAQALAGMMAKHTVSLYDMLNSGKKYPLELWDEKITDHINYLLLLSAMVRE